MTVRPAALGWAVVGTGTVSHSIASDLRNVDGARRVAVWSRNANNAKAFATKHGFERAHNSLDSLLASPDVEVVYIATPHATHAALAIAALDAGKHVLIEKPIGVDAAEAQAIAEAARRNERFAMEGMWMRFNPAYISLRAEAASGVLGNVSAVRASFGLPFGDVSSPAWSAERKSSTLLDQAIYAVTLVRDILGEPTNVSSTAHRRDDGVDVMLNATLEFTDGRFAQLAASMVTYLEPTATVSGTNGWATLAAPFWATDSFRRHAGDFEHAFGHPTDCRYPLEGNGYVPMLRAVQDTAAAGLMEHPLHPLDDSIAILTTLDRIRAAWSPMTPV